MKTCGLIEQESIKQAAYEWHNFWTKFTVYNKIEKKNLISSKKRENI